MQADFRIQASRTRTQASVIQCLYLERIVERSEISPWYFVRIEQTSKARCLMIVIPERSMVVVGSASDLDSHLHVLHRSLPVNQGANSMTRTGVINVEYKLHDCTGIINVEC